ncbi:MAG: hypothetical protein Q4C20_01830 [Erysipelotrichaceae bacterium]|nr:hypothetical protein [Erysipelotrichaceae bacterium]
MKKLIILLAMLLCIPAYYLYRNNEETCLLKAEVQKLEAEQNRLNEELEEQNSIYKANEEQLAVEREAAAPFIEEYETWSERTEQLQKYLP